VTHSRHAARDLRLSRVEFLLTEAFEDLTALSREAPGSRCAAALAEAAAELQAFAQTQRAQVDNPFGNQGATLRKQLSALLPRLRNLDRLLASAAKFYCGWCAAAPVAPYPVPYPWEQAYASGQSGQAYGASNDRSPALLAFRG
jgi:hypothetical protein